MPIQAMLDECAETRFAIREFTLSATLNKDNGYAYAAGALSVVLEDAISLLPKAKRAEFRERLFRMATTAYKDAA